VITFEHDVTGAPERQDIRALHFPAGHTDGRCGDFLSKRNNVVHMGDILCAMDFFYRRGERRQRAGDD